MTDHDIEKRIRKILSDFEECGVEPFRLELAETEALLDIIDATRKERDAWKQSAERKKELARLEREQAREVRDALRAELEAVRREKEALSKTIRDGMHWREQVK